MLWVRVIKTIFGDEGGLNGHNPSGNIGSIWVNILKSTKELDKKNVSLDNFAKKRVGDGKNTKFWEDSWIADRPLKYIYPRVFMLDVEEEALVENRRNFDVGAVWLRRPPRGGLEFEQWSDLTNVVHSFIFSQQSDRWVWTGDDTGVFSVASARSIIDKGTLVLDVYPTRWHKELPIKVNVFAWKMLLDKLPTRLNLSIRGMEIHSISCRISDRVNESIFHVIVECMVAKEVWRMVEFSSSKC